MKNTPLRDAPLAEPAETERALSFVRELWERRRDKKLVKDYLDRLPYGELQGIGRRIMMDIMKAPPGGAPGPSATSAESESKEPVRAAPRRGRAKPGGTGRQRPARKP